MKLATLHVDEGTRAAVDTDSGWVTLPFTDVAQFLGAEDWRATAETARTSNSNTTVPEAEARYASVVTTDRKIICCGLNYSDHILEMGRELPNYPTLFAKYTDTLTGPTEPISTAGSDAVDWEAELAVVVGTRLTRADKVEAASAIAGYCVANDVSMRDWQKRTLQWFQGKNFTASTPLGPWLTTADDFDADPHFTVEGWINNERVQHGDTSTLVFPPAELLAYISTFTTLNPGDVVLTGTPGGVGQGMQPPRYAVAGDTIRTRILGLGTLENAITD